MESSILAYSRLRTLLLQFDSSAVRVSQANGYARLPGSNMMVLITMAARPGLTQVEIADTLGLSRQAMVPIMDMLEDLGLAQRSNPPGKRLSELVLTPQGSALVDLLEAELAATFGPETMDALSEALGKVRVSVPL